MKDEKHVENCAESVQSLRFQNYVFYLLLWRQQSGNSERGQTDGYAVGVMYLFIYLSNW